MNENGVYGNRNELILSGRKTVRFKWGQEGGIKKNQLDNLHPNILRKLIFTVAFTVSQWVWHNTI